MDNHYVCPFCRGHLRVGDYIIFRIRNTLREKGLLLLHPEGGSYSSIKHPAFHFEEGERMDFYCPICLQSLDAAIDENLVKVLMVDRSGEESVIYFSRIADKDSTYSTSGDEAGCTGEDFSRYTHFQSLDNQLPYLQN